MFDHLTSDHDKAAIHLSNDPHEVHGMQAGFQLPRAIWRSMFVFYGIFFVGIAAAAPGAIPRPSSCSSSRCSIR